MTSLCLTCALVGALVAAIALVYLLHRSHERFRKSHTKDSK